MRTERTPHWMDDLEALVACHSTPGDEDEVACHLLRVWGEAGWTVSRHGRSAVSAALGAAEDDCPTLLVCAHMDSPGYAVETVGERRTSVIPLGKPSPGEGPVDVVLKRGSERVCLKLHQAPVEGKDVRGRDGVAFWVRTVRGVRPGDRLCFSAGLEVEESGQIAAPFLDNRLGCAVLCELARRWREAPPEVNVVLGATACEEMGGFGAPVLARAVAPHLVFCLDATYDNGAQGVRLGGGPVLTLSDASVLLGCRERDALLDLAQSAGVSLQTEVYNYSGTDARAFPHAGLDARVYPLLLPTTGNHTPRETACFLDVEDLVDLLVAIASEDRWCALLEPGF